MNNIVGIADNAVSIRGYTVSNSYVVFDAFAYMTVMLISYNVF